jgi:hypothetical protein
MDERCDDCGFVYDERRAGEARGEIASTVAGLVALLNDDPLPASRRHRDTWSPLEYACHVRDVLLVQRERVLTARRRDLPSFEPMGREERVAHDGYAEQAAEDVARQLGDAALMFANVLDRLGPADWMRTVVYNYPAPQERSLAWVAVHSLHEAVHHTADVRRQVT